ncbi:MAG: alpha/beta fold hydrolase [Proteobacteria bacterium]|nr:alpha/beta fold hydrolase [Pseudomonadota bacterium]
MEDGFKPKPWARNSHLQTIFASLGIRVAGKNPMVDCSEEMIIDGGNGVRLLGYHSVHPQENGRGLILLIHGWEGSSDSTYILSTGRYLYKKGYDIFRLNLRDHGNSHHLNEGLFHGALIDETFNAIRNIAHLSGGRPYCIVGFSLGGNFALRAALKHSTSKIANLKRVICISPSLDPHKATISIDESPFVYHYYFLKKWKRSLMKKQEIFPDKYNFDDALGLKTCMEITDVVIPRYTQFCDHREYFDSYTLSGDIFKDLSVPVTVIASEDDPVIPVDDLYSMRKNSSIQLLIQRYGGHCGFLDPFPFGCWYERKIYDILESEKAVG